MGFETFSQNDSKAAPAGSKSTWLLFSSTSICMLLKERIWSKCGKGIHGFPSYAEHHEVLSSQQASFLIFQSLCHPVKRGEKCEVPFERPPFPSWFSEHCDSLECHLSSIPFFLTGFWLLLPCMFILQGSFQLTHFVSVIRQIRRSKITASVVSHSSRSTSLLSKIVLLDCSAWGIIDQYQVCSLFCIWLLNLTHCVLISYAVLVLVMGLRSSMYAKLSRGWQQKNKWLLFNYPNCYN